MFPDVRFGPSWITVCLFGRRFAISNCITSRVMLVCGLNFQIGTGIWLIFHTENFFLLFVIFIPSVLFLFVLFSPEFKASLGFLVIFFPFSRGKKFFKKRSLFYQHEIEEKSQQGIGFECVLASTMRCLQQFISLCAQGWIYSWNGMK